MNKIISFIKNTFLFLFGIFLIIWGYKANATNSNIKDKEEKEPVISKDIEAVTNTSKSDSVKTDILPTQETKPIRKIVTPNPVKKEKKVKTGEKKTEKKEEVKETTIETATPEKSSGTE